MRRKVNSFHGLSTGSQDLILGASALNPPPVWTFRDIFYTGGRALILQ
jgi:hypothetical protein